MADAINYNLNQNLSFIFKLIEENKTQLNIESYFLSNTTLEQVFMSFANKPLKKVNEYSSPLKYGKKINSTSGQFYSRQSLDFNSTTASNECILLSFSTKNC